MIKSISVAIGLLAMTAIIATSGIAIQSAQARIEPVPGSGGGGCPVGGCTPAPPTPPIVPDTAAITNAANHATAEGLKQTSTQITSNPSLSDLAKNIISSKMNNYVNLLEGVCPNVANDNCAR